MFFVLFAVAGVVDGHVGVLAVVGVVGVVCVSVSSGIAVGLLVFVLVMMVLYRCFL